MTDVQPAFEISQAESMQWNRTVVLLKEPFGGEPAPVDDAVAERVRRMLEATASD